MAARAKNKSIKTLKDLAPVIESHKDQLAENAKTLVLQEFKSVFAAHPELDAIRWRQITPPMEFNDEMASATEFRIDGIEYKLKGARAQAMVPYADPNLTDTGFEGNDGSWASPWNDRRLDDPALIDSLSELEERLFDAEASLAQVFGDQHQVTVTRTSVTLENGIE